MLWCMGSVKQPRAVGQSRELDPRWGEAYAAFRSTEAGQAIYREFVERALRLRRSGFRHYGAQALIEAVRYDSSVTPGAKRLRVDNSVAAFLSREAMARHVDLRGFFETRPSVADGAHR